MNVLPPLNALHAFARVAQTGSMVDAAQVLNVTPAAVSQQVRRLEQFLETKLVQKYGRGVLLTDEGQILSRAVLNGLEQIELGVSEITRPAQTKVVSVTTSPSFATYWFVPRISKFQLAYPEISIQLDITAEAQAATRPKFDLAIRYCKWEDLPDGADLLTTVSLNVLCPTPLLPASPWATDALAGLPWLQELGVTEIRDWFSRQGIQQNLPVRVSEMPGNLIIEALKRGEAVAYTVCDWVLDELKSGGLHELWPTREKGAYYMLTQNSGADDATATFMQWLRDETNDSGLGAPDLSV